MQKHASPYVPRKVVIALHMAGIAVMNIELGPLKRRRRNIFLIRGDDLAVGREAANEFLRSGWFQTYAYLPYNGNPIWSRERGSGFAERLRTRGLKPSIFDRSVPLSDWLTSLAHEPLQAHLRLSHVRLSFCARFFTNCHCRNPSTRIRRKPSHTRVHAPLFMNCGASITETPVLHSS